MDEPRDDIDTWLEERVTPLLPRPGTFEQVRKRARRRKLGQAAMAVAGAAVVVAGAIIVPRLVLPGHVGGAPVAQSRSTTPAQQNSPSPAQPSPSGTAGSVDGSATPTASPTSDLVPPNFAASSVTFVSQSTGWVIGQAGTPGHCGPPNAYICTSMAVTNDAGQTWHGVPAPVTGAPDGATGVSQIRSLNGASGWAFGPQLYATHDAGLTWHRIPTHAMRVTGLETVNGVAFAIWAQCAGTGANFAAGCTNFSLYSSPASQDDWTPVAGVTGLGASGGTPASAQLVLTGSRGYLLAPGGQLFSGPVTSGAHWHLVTSAPGTPVTLPCAPGAAEVGGRPLQAMLASTGPGLALLCPGQRSGSTQTKNLFYSADGGRTWNPAGPAPAPGIAMSLSGSLDGPVMVATSDGIDVSTPVPGNGTVSWRTARGAGAPGGYSYVGMTTAQQGVAVPAKLGLDAIWFTYDGGARWHEALIH